MNIWEHPTIIAAEALRHLEDSLVIGPLCTRDTTSEFTNTANGWKVGDAVPFRTNGEFVVKEFVTEVEPQPITGSSRTMLIEKHLDVSVEFTAKEEALDLDDLAEQVLAPATYKLAEYVDSYLGSKILQGAGLFVSNALFTTAGDVAQARKNAILQQLNKDRFCLVDSDTEAMLLGQDWFTGATNRGAAGERTLNDADMGHTMGMDFKSSVAFPTNTMAHTAGTGTAATDNVTVPNSNIPNTRVLYCTALSAAINLGDRMFVAGLKRPLIAAATASAGATQILLVDPIVEIIADASAITVIGAGLDLTYHGAIFDDRALASAFPALDLPQDKVSASASSNGISIRIVKGYDQKFKKTMLSLDLLVGAFMLDPRRTTLLAEGI